LQCLRIPPSDRTDHIGGLEAFFTSPEVLPKMRQMIDRVRVDPLLHRIGPLLIRDCHVLNLPTDGSSESFGHLSYRRRFAHQWVGALKWRTRISKQGCSYTVYILRPDEWNNGSALAPWQENGAFFGDALAYSAQLN